MLHVFIKCKLYINECWTDTLYGCSYIRIADNSCDAVDMYGTLLIIQMCTGIICTRLYFIVSLLIASSLQFHVI